MSTPITTRRTRRRNTSRPHAASRWRGHHPTLTDPAKRGRPEWYGSTHRLPNGFMQAVIDEFVRSSRAHDRARRVYSVLEEFNQAEDLLPSKIRRLLKRFDDGGDAR